VNGVRLAVVLLAGCLSACAAASSVVASKGRELSYGEVQAVQPGLTAAQVLDAFGDPARVGHGPDGRVRTIEYAVRDSEGGSARLHLGFDEREVLVSKRYSGPVTRP
jgi:hypothetical protein